MNKRYDNLWLKIVYLMAEDVITASGGGAFTDSNFDDGTQDDIYFIGGEK